MNFSPSLNLPLILAASVLLALAGMVVFILARRGRRIDDHPVCRKCGYDLTGRPETSSRCSECGADLARRRAIRIGNRQRFVGLGRMGVMAGLMGLAVAGWSGYGVARTIEWVRYEPLSWLVKDFENGTAAEQRQAETEILRRLRARQISKANLRWMIDHALDQEIAAKNGPSIWRELLGESFNLRLVEEEQEDRYIEHVKLLLAEVVDKLVILTPTEVLSGRQITIQISRVAFAFPNYPQLTRMPPFNGRPGSLLPLSPRIDIAAVWFDSLPASLRGEVSTLGRDRQLPVYPPWDGIRDRIGDVHDLTVHVQVEMTFEGQREKKKSTMDLELKRKVHVPGGVSGDRTI